MSILQSCLLDIFSFELRLSLVVHFVILIYSSANSSRHINSRIKNNDLRVEKIYLSGLITVKQPGNISRPSLNKHSVIFCK